MQQNRLKINADCIIPAAGLSSRMGCWKLALPFQDSTILERSVQNARESCEQVIVVAGEHVEQVREILSPYKDVLIIENPHYQLGLLSSIRVGLEYVTRDYFYIAHADMPYIAYDIFAALWHRRLAGAVFPGNLEHSGHPVLVSSRMMPRIFSSHALSMKAILSASHTIYLALQDESIHLDVDTPDAYQRLINQR